VTETTQDIGNKEIVVTEAMIEATYESFTSLVRLDDASNHLSDSDIKIYTKELLRQLKRCPNVVEFFIEVDKQYN